MFGITFVHKEERCCLESYSWRGGRAVDYNGLYCWYVKYGTHLLLIHVVTPKPDFRLVVFVVVVMMMMMMMMMLVVVVEVMMTEILFRCILSPRVVRNIAVIVSNGCII